MPLLLSDLAMLEIILFLGGSILAIIQWLLKKWVTTLETSVAEIQKNQHELDKEVQKIKETYVVKTDLREIKNEIVSRLERIENYLLGKQNV